MSPQNDNMGRDIWKAWWTDGRPGAFVGSAYNAAVANWVKNGQHSRGDAPQSLVEFTALNAVRMKRVSKTSQISPSLVGLLKTEPIGRQQWTVITESWCGDAAQTGPLISAMAESAGVEIHWMLRDTPPLIIQDFLTRGSKSIPLWVISDEAGRVLGQWGPRPQALQTLVLANKSQREPRPKADMAIEIQLWYARNRGRAFFLEAEALLRQTCTDAS